MLIFLVFIFAPFLGKKKSLNSLLQTGLSLNTEKEIFHSVQIHGDLEIMSKHLEVWITSDDRHISLENPTLNSWAQAIKSTRNKTVHRELSSTFMVCGLLQACWNRNRLKKPKVFVRIMPKKWVPQKTAGNFWTFLMCSCHISDGVLGRGGWKRLLSLGCPYMTEENEKHN